MDSECPDKIQVGEYISCTPDKEILDLTLGYMAVMDVTYAIVTVMFTIWRTSEIEVTALFKIFFDKKQKKKRKRIYHRCEGR